MKNVTPRWLSLLGTTVMAVLLVACSGGFSTDGESTIYEPTVNVTVKDFSISLDPSQIEAGMITFAVKNNGSITHDFAIRGNGVDQKTPMIEAGETASFTVALEPDTYTYICTIPGHEQLGMSGTLTISSTDVTK